LKRVCVFCGSSSGVRSGYARAATALAEQIVAHDLELVYGGGNVGLMGVVADSVLAHGGKVTGVIPQALMDKEVGHTGITDLRVVADMHERKALMAELSDGFIALPGGWGTLEELFEVMTWLQLGFHAKPCAVFNVESYYDNLLEFLSQATTEGFVKPLHTSMLIAVNAPDELIQRMLAFTPPKTQKWIGWGDQD